MELYEARHLVEMTVARQPNLLEGSFGALSNFEPVHCDKHLMPPGFECDCRSRYLRPFHLGRALSDPMLWLASAAFSISPKSLPNGGSIEPLDSVVLALTGFTRTPPCDADTRTPTSGSHFSLHSRNPKNRRGGPRRTSAARKLMLR